MYYFSLFFVIMCVSESVVAHLCGLCVGVCLFYFLRVRFLDFQAKYITEMIRKVESSRFGKVGK